MKRTLLWLTVLAGCLLTWRFAREDVSTAVLTGVCAVLSELEFSRRARILAGGEDDR